MTRHVLRALGLSLILAATQAEAQVVVQTTTSTTADVTLTARVTTTQTQTVMVPAPAVVVLEQPQASSAPSATSAGLVPLLTLRGELTMTGAHDMPLAGMTALVGAASRGGWGGGLVAGYFGELGFSGAPSELHLALEAWRDFEPDESVAFLLLGRVGTRSCSIRRVRAQSSWASWASGRACRSTTASPSCSTSEASFVRVRRAPSKCGAAPS